MTHTVKFTTKAQKEFKKLPKDVQKRILSSLELLRINPFAEILQFKKLKGANLYRIRIGNYRVIYEIRSEVLIIIVVRLGHRKDVYRYLNDN